MRNILVLVGYFTMVNGLALLGVVWAIRSFERGQYPTVVVTSGLALALLGIESSLLRVLLGRVVPRVTVDEQVTVIRPDTFADGVLQWATLSAVIAVAAYAIFGAMGKVDIPSPFGDGRVLQIFAVGVTLTGLANLAVLFKRGGSSLQRLTPTGFELAQGVSSVKGEWDDVIAVTDRRRNKPKPLRSMLFVEFRDGRVRSQVVDSYTPGGLAIRRLFTYYWANPSRRDDLANGRAVERFADFEGGS